MPVPAAEGEKVTYALLDMFHKTLQLNVSTFECAAKPNTCN